MTTIRTENGAVSNVSGLSSGVIEYMCLFISDGESGGESRALICSGGISYKEQREQEKGKTTHALGSNRARMAYERARGGHATKSARNKDSQGVREEDGDATGFVGCNPVRAITDVQHRERRASDRDIDSREGTVDIVIRSKQSPKMESLWDKLVREVRSQCPEATF